MDFRLVTDRARRALRGLVLPAAGPAALWVAALMVAPTQAFALTLPPLQVEILDAQRHPLGRADVYLNYVEVADAAGQPRGAIGVLNVEGQARLFLVQSNGDRKMVGWAEDHRLYSVDNKLIGYYVWTPIWSYVYDGKLKKVGEAQCLAYQGVCAAGVAGFLLGLY